MNCPQIRRGDIFYVKKGRTVGSEQFAGRPGIIVSNDENNKHSSTVEIVYTTARHKPYLPTHVTTKGTSQLSTVLCEQVTTVSVERLENYIGRCTAEEMSKIENAILISLGINGRCPRNIMESELGADEMSVSSLR